MCYVGLHFKIWRHSLCLAVLFNVNVNLASRKRLFRLDTWTLVVYYRWASVYQQIRTIKWPSSSVICAASLLWALEVLPCRYGLYFFIAAQIAQVAQYPSHLNSIGWVNWEILAAKKETAIEIHPHSPWTNYVQISVAIHLRKCKCVFEAQNWWRFQLRDTNRYLNLYNYVTRLYFFIVPLNCPSCSANTIHIGQATWASPT